MIEVIEQTTDRAKLDHDLIVPITTYEEYLLQDSCWPNWCFFLPFGGRVLAHLPECCLDQDHKSQATHHYPLWIVSGEGAYRLPYWCSQYCCSFPFGLRSIVTSINLSANYPQKNAIPGGDPSVLSHFGIKFQNPESETEIDSYPTNLNISNI